MQNKEDLFGFFTDHNQPNPNFTPITIRLYALYQIREKHGPVIEDWLTKNFDFLNVLPSIQVSSNYEFEDQNITLPSDIALLFMVEQETTRRPQQEWFDVMTKDVRSKAERTLIITSSNIIEEITKKRKLSYEQSIPGITVEYFKHDSWSLKENEVLIPILNCIKNFILQFKEDRDTQPQCSCSPF